MAIELGALLLSVPISWVTSFTYDKLKQLSQKLEKKPKPQEFQQQFIRNLDTHKGEYGEGIKRFKSALKGKENEFVEIFNKYIRDYNTYVAQMKQGTLFHSIAHELVKHFTPEEDFKDVMEIIVRESLEDYRHWLPKHLTEEEQAQLNAIQEEAKEENKQIKILSITASPDDENAIQYEREQDTMLDAFKPFDREDVFLDMPDPVKSTLVEIQEHLKEGKHDILHITAHGGVDDHKTGKLELEDHHGNPQKVTGEELTKALVPKPRIVILSACHSARKEPDLMPVAKALKDAGIEVVIGMKNAVSHDAAIAFNGAFFQALIDNHTVNEAFEAGKLAIGKDEERRRKENPNSIFESEQDIPQLLAGPEGKGLRRKDFSTYRIDAPGRPESHRFGGAKYLERGFIGRRQVIRKIYKAIENHLGAVVLKGPGGIGKSTLTTRMTANLNRQGFGFIVVRDETTVEDILEKISRAATDCGIQEAENVKAAKADPLEKLGWLLENFLLKHKTVLIFDNFEVNQDEENGDFLETKQRLKKFLWQFREWLKGKDTMLFFSTRYRIPGFDSPDVEIDIREFSDIEFRKKLLNTDALKQLDMKSIASLKREVGGNPRALELLDKIAYKEFRQKEFTWEKLKNLIPQLRERIIHKQDSDDDFTPLFLGRLMGYLSDNQKEILGVLSVYRRPVPIAAIEYHKLKMPNKDRGKLLDFSLMERLESEEENFYYVHRLTAQFVLEGMEPKELKKRHNWAGKYFDGIRYEENAVDLGDAIEARWHYLQAGRWKRAASLTFDLESYLRNHGSPHWAMELILELESYLKKLDKKQKAVFHQRIGVLLQDFGQYDEALEQYQKALVISREMDNLPNTAATFNQIGIIHGEKGQHEDALEKFKEARDIFQQLGVQRELASSLHHIGIIHQEKGQHEDALEKYEEARKIFKQIGAQMELASSLHHIGIIHQKKGQYEDALEKFRESLEMMQKIGNTKGIATSLHQIGIIHQLKGQYEDAFEKFQESLEIKKKIDDTKGIASSLHHIGSIHQLKGQYEDALEKFRESLEIKKKIGDIAGQASSLGQMGSLHLELENYETALRYFIQAFAIFNKLGSPYAKQAASLIAEVRQKLPEGRFEEILKEMEEA